MLIIFNKKEIKMKNLNNLICIHKENKKIERCDTCCGMTNTCGFYENKKNERIFEGYFNQQSVIEIKEEYQL